MLTDSATVITAYQFNYAVCVNYTVGGHEITASLDAAGFGHDCRPGLWIASFRVIKRLQGGRFHRFEEQCGSPAREEVATWLASKICPPKDIL